MSLGKLAVIVIVSCTFLIIGLFLGTREQKGKLMCFQTVVCFFIAGFVIIAIILAAMAHGMGLFPKFLCDIINYKI